MFRLLDSLVFTLERLWQHRVLVFWALVGLAAATTLALSLWQYVDAVNTGLLESRLPDPPYHFRFRYLGAWNGNITRADVDAATAVVLDSFTRAIGLPTQQTVRFTRGPAWSLRLSGGQNLGVFSLGALEGADAHISIVSGEWPAPETEDGATPVLLSEKMLYTTGVQVGDKLTATLPGGQTLELRVAALWRPTDSRDPSWIFTPKFFDEVLLVEPGVLWGALEGIERPVEEVAWQLIFDGGGVRTSDVNSLLQRIADGQRDVVAALPGIRQDVSPMDALNAFNVEVNRLTQQLVIVILPVGGLALYFVSMVAGLLVSRQQGEDVTLRSRGMSRRAVLGIHALMWLILAGLALAVGAALSPLVVRLVGQTTSFLRFDDTASRLDVVFSVQALAAGAATGLVAASSGLYLAWRASRQTVTSFRQSAARASRAWWQRAYLDVLLLIPAVYMLYTLWRQGGLVAQAEDPFSDPLAFVAPTLFSLGCTLLFLRIWPLALRLGAALIAYGRGVVLLMALRELTRSIGRYRGALLMMGFTLSLTGFTASMASTIDRSLEDSVNYRIGADLALVIATDAQTEQDAVEEGEQQTYTVTGYNIPPAEDLLGIEGVAQVSPAGRYPARIVLPGQRLEGTILGVDRAAMAAVARFRQDYADESLGELLNRLAGNRTGILLSRSTAEQYNLVVGQEVALQISALGQWHDTRAPIAGLVDYFPTLDPNDGFFAVANIEPIFELVGTPLPHDLWLSLKPGADEEAVRAQVLQLGFPVIRWLDPQEALQQAYAAPARRGVLGFLSVGFIAAILLTLVGAIIQSAASFRAQSVQLGALRAMGLGGLSVAAYLLLSQGMAAASGIASGTSIGVGVTLLFLPLLDFSGGLPPYLVRVAWDDIIRVYTLFAGVLLFVTLFTALLLSRERLSAVIKLGDA